MEIYDLSRVRQPQQNRTLQVINADVCVIGSGAGGSAFAYEMAVQGRNVVILEEGFYYTGKDFKDRSPSEILMLLFRDAGISFTVGNAHMLIPTGKCVGGTTTINSGTTLRMTQTVFERFWKEKAGVEEITWEELTQAYARVEKLTSIYPVPEHLIGANANLFKTGAAKLDMAAVPVNRNQMGCVGSARCFLGCPIDAKLSTNLTYIPMALKEGATLYVGCRADEILVRKGVAEGVRASFIQKNGGNEKVIGRLVVNSPLVVVASGAFFTPLILRKSGLHHPLLGKGCRMHPAGRVAGLYDQEIHMWEGVPQSLKMDALQEEEGISFEGISMPPSILAPTLPWKRGVLKRIMADYAKLGVMGVRIIEQESAARVYRSPLTGEPTVRYDFHREDIKRMQKAIALAARMLFEAGAREVYLPVYRFEILRSQHDLWDFESAALHAHDIEMSAYHPFGTARMATNPEKGVVNQRGEVWGVKGLVVSDASVFPDSSYVNPQETIMALATLFAKKQGS